MTKNQENREKAKFFLPLILMIKGFLMGVADVIPGVSGGTIALIVGIYEELIETISNYDIGMIRLLLTGKWKELARRLNLNFILPLFAGIVIAIFGLARVMSYLLHHHESQTFAVFFGLILGSIVFMVKKFKPASVNYLFLFLGAAFTFWIIGLIPVETPATLLAYFLSAVIAICAMILPGISGSFLLLLLGKYKQVMEVIKNPFAKGNLLIILVFGLGALIGIVGFSKLLKWLLAHYHDMLFAFLIGMMIGSLRKLWPFYQGGFSPADVGLKIGLMVLGLAIVLGIQKLEQLTTLKKEGKA